MITIARKFVVDRCDRCGRLALLNLAMGDTGGQVLWCERCTLSSGTDGLIDPLENIRWPRNENATLLKH